MRRILFVLAAVSLVCVGGSPNTVKVMHYKLGSNANLKCGNETSREMVYVIWNLDLSHRNCQIGLEYTRQPPALHDSCKDGKSLLNTSSARPYLHIPSMTGYDEGLYECQLAYTGGAEKVLIRVVLIVPPSPSAWLEWRDSRRVAVCRAERGKPAANISWSQGGNSSSSPPPSLETQINSDGSVTVESRLEIPEGRDVRNLTCVIRHPYWESEEKILEPKPHKGLPMVVYILTVGMILVLLTGSLLFTLKKRKDLRCCWKAEPSLSKSQLTEGVEEVEPYASYVQRVNSIYNS